MPLKVLMFGWEFPPYNSGGLGVACEGLLRALRPRAEVTFVLPRRISVRAEGVRFRFAEEGGLKVEAIDSLLYPYATPGEYRAIRAGQGELSLYGATLVEEVRRYAGAVASLIEGEEFDVLHAHDWLSFLAGIEAKRVLGKPLVVHVHATEFDRGGGSVNPEVYEIERRGMEEADAVIAVSERTKRDIVEHYRIAPQKVSVVHNGVEIEKVGNEARGLRAFKRAGVKIVLFVGRLTLQKGPDYFLALAKRVAALYPRVVFVVLGSGDMEAQMVHKAAELGLSGHVFFGGYLRGEELASVYRSADLYVMPSVSEPFGIAPLESLCHGTPALISKQSGVSEVLTHVLKSDFWDIDDMADKVVSVLRNPPLRQTLAKEGEEDARRSTWEKAAALCCRLYRSLVPMGSLKRC